MPTSNTQRPANTAPLSQPDDAAVDLLSDLESRLGALRSWQSQSEAQAEQVRQRSRKLEDRQQELDDQAEQLKRDRAAHVEALAALQADRADADTRRRELEADLAELDAAQAGLESRRRDLEAHAADVENELDAKHRELEAEEARRLGEVGELEALAADQAAQAAARLAEAKVKQADVDQRFTELQDAQTKLDEARELLADRVAKADQRDAELDAREARLDEVARKLEAERAKLDERAADLEAKAKELDRLSDELDAELTRLDERQIQLDAAKQDLDAQRTELQGNQEAYRQAKFEQELRAEELEAREASLTKARQKLLTEANDGKLDAVAKEQRQAELNQQAEELAALRKAHEAAVAELESARQETATHRAALTAAQGELTGAQTLIAQRETELVRLRDQLDTRVDELSELRQQLAAAEANAQAAPSLPPAFGAIDDVSSAESDEDDDLPSFTFGHHSPEAAPVEPAADASLRLDKLQALVEEREIEIADLRSQLETQAEELQVARASADDLQLRLDAALAKSDAATADHTDRDSDTDARVEALAGKLAEREAQLDDVQHDLDARIAEVQLLREQIDSLNNQLAQGHHFDDDAAAEINDQEFQRRRNELDEQAAQIAADRQRVLDRKLQLKQADEIIKQRREKIRQYIKLARAQAGEAGPAGPAGFAASAPIAASDAARLAGIDKERAALAEVKQFLEQSEAAMVRRWATNKTGSLVTSTVIAVILAVGFSFFVGSHFATPLYRATMAVEVQPEGDAAELPPGAWLTDYKRTLLSEPVLAEALNQMDQLGVRIAGTPAQLDAILRENLAATGKPGRVELAYHGSDTAQVGAVLEAYGRGLLIHHMAEDRKAGRLSDSARVLQPAVAESEPVHDDRLKFALATFAAIVAAAALLALPLRLLYGRSQRVLHEDFMPELVKLDTHRTDEPDAADFIAGNPAPKGIRNDGPPAGFARIPADVDQDEDDAQEPPTDEQVFRF